MVIFTLQHTMTLMYWMGGVTAVAAVALFAFRAYLLRANVPKEQLDNPELLRGKTILLTGATAGIGLATAKALHRMGARVIFGARDPKRAEKAIQEIRSARSASARDAPPVECLDLDLADLASVQQFVTEFRNKNVPLDYLINNAGAVFMNNGVTKDGFERCWQINALSHFLLTTSLLDIINKNKTRVINLTSGAHAFVKKYEPLTYEDVHSDMTTHKVGGSGYMGAYSLSKLSNVFFYKELLRRVDDGVIVVGVNPGFVQTEIGREAPGFLVWIIRIFEGLLAKTPLQGAFTTLKLVLADKKDVVNGGYYEDCELSKVTDIADNKENQLKFWELCEQCVQK
jgi:NAD(P)-dependent dehydrogenase (short-subunit alcohol dehydrogenase family)